MIAAVDLLKGIAVGAGMETIEVEGANGSLDTNYEGKVKAALSALLKDNKEFVYIHIEGPDEMGHQGNAKNKVKSIEYIDAKVIKTLLEELKSSGQPFKMLFMPDHPTPIKYRTHTANPVPYLIYNSDKELNKTWNYNEKEAEASRNFIDKGHALMNKFLAE